MRLFKTLSALFEGDGYTLVWRRLASKFNRGLQVRGNHKPREE